MKTRYWTSLGFGSMFVWIAVAAAAEPVELFNGKDLGGWTKRGGAATYAVEDGAIVGRSVPDTSNTFLATDKEYGDFELELDFKIDDPTFNSGVQIRSHARPEGDRERVYGYQVEIDPRPDRGWSAGLYFEGGSEHRDAGWLDDLADNEAARNAFKLGEWNHLKVVADGRRIQTWLNGVPAADFTDSDEKAFTPRGFIALQVHSVGDAKEPKEVRWRNIRLVELAEGGATPWCEPRRSFCRSTFGPLAAESHGDRGFSHFVGAPFSPRWLTRWPASGSVLSSRLGSQFLATLFAGFVVGPCSKLCKARCPRGRQATIWGRLLFHSVCHDLKNKVHHGATESTEKSAQSDRWLRADR